MDKGYVYLIGAGPGDPDLLTQKAAKALKKRMLSFMTTCQMINCFPSASRMPSLYMSASKPLIMP